MKKESIMNASKTQKDIEQDYWDLIHLKKRINWKMIVSTNLKVECIEKIQDNINWGPILNLDSKEIKDT